MPQYFTTAQMEAAPKGLFCLLVLLLVGVLVMAGVDTAATELRAQREERASYEAAVRRAQTPQIWVTQPGQELSVALSAVTEQVEPNTVVAVGRSGAVIYDVMQGLPYRIVPTKPEAAAILVKITPSGAPRPARGHDGEVHGQAVDWAVEAVDRLSGKVLAKDVIPSRGFPRDSPDPFFEQLGLGDVDAAAGTRIWIRQIPVLASAMEAAQK